MANKIFEPNPAGFNALRNSEGVQRELLRRAELIASAATNLAPLRGAQYGADVQPGKRRAHARAYSENRAAYWSNFNGNKTLVSAIDAGRG